MSNTILIENDQQIPFLEKPQNEDLNVLESHYSYFITKCNEVENELNRPGNKKDYIFHQNVWRTFLQLDFIESVEKIFYKVKKDPVSLEKSEKINSLLIERVQTIKQKIDKISKVFLDLLDISIKSLERDIISNRKIYLENPEIFSQINALTDPLICNQTNYSDLMKNDMKKTQEIINNLDLFRKKVNLTKKSVEQFHNIIKNNVIETRAEYFEVLNPITENLIDREETTSNSKYLCLSTSIGFLLIILLTLMIAYYLKLSNLI